ncbi:hypothetical protein AMTR_s00059p00200440 [Amborella trichopoda]|uniref:Uncharacterized protein n=1 Tax=Amborella trichopoda TaxID=13333 RepID=U5DBA4_AMBTC|nr:hypothetical protein AMTR_s00059p00200440 [Amborella trichopoda]
MRSKKLLCPTKDDTDLRTKGIVPHFKGMNAFPIYDAGRHIMTALEGNAPINAWHPSIFGVHIAILTMLQCSTITTKLLGHHALPYRMVV